MDLLCEVDWSKVIELILPIGTVALAGWFALRRMRENVKLEAKLKWKDDFRDRLKLYVNQARTIHQISVGYNIENLNDTIEDYENYFFTGLKDFDVSYYELDLMLTKDDRKVEKLFDLNNKLVNHFMDNFHKVKNDTNGFELIDNFYKIAKELYQDEEYVESCL